MTLLDKIQKYIVEILGTLIALIFGSRFIVDGVSGSMTFPLAVYVVSIVVGLILMGHKKIGSLILSRGK